jgi:hypothetical protein
VETASRDQIKQLVKRYHPKSMEMLDEDFLDFPNAPEYEQQAIFLRTPQYTKGQLVKAAEDADLSLNLWCMEALALPKNRALEIARREVFGHPSSQFQDEESPEFLEMVEEDKAKLTAIMARKYPDKTTRAATLKVEGGKEELPDGAAH